MLTIYNSQPSGNCYKVRLLCALLDIQCTWINKDILNQEIRTPEFLAINPLGQVPVLLVNSKDTQKILTESNAILFYLAQRSVWIPDDPFEQAKMWQWLLYEQTDIRPNLAAIRFIKKYPHIARDRSDEYKVKFAKSQTVLSYLDTHLSKHTFFLGDNISLADIAIYAYTHVVDEGGIELSNYPNLGKWFARIAALPNYISLSQQR